MKRFLTISVCVAALCLSAQAGTAKEQDKVPLPPEKMHEKSHEAKHEAGKPVHWGYMGKESPYNWGDLDPAYEACKMGQTQSPVNLDGGLDIDLPEIVLSYNPVPLSVVNNGHTVQQNYKPGSLMSVGGKKEYELMQVHFHTPSEHLIRGMAAPMEAHFVHKAKDGTIAVLGVMMRIGRENESLQKVWSVIPPAGETSENKDVGINARNLLPANLDYYRYDGSLTTPPCTEGVKWYVLQTPIEISEDQFRAFRKLFPVNARPVQPLNQRGFFK